MTGEDRVNAIAGKTQFLKPRILPDPRERKKLKNGFFVGQEGTRNDY